MSDHSAGTQRSADIQKARRRLNKLVDQGRLERIEGASGGSDETRQPTVWRWIEPLDDLVSNHGNNYGKYEASTNAPEASTDGAKVVAAQQVGEHGTNYANYATEHVSAPSLEGGGKAGASTTETRLVERTIGGERVKFDLATGETFPLGAES